MHDGDGRSALWHLNNFLRSLCLRPELGSRVRNISLNPWTSVNSGYLRDTVLAEQYCTPDPMIIALLYNKIESLENSKGRQGPVA